MIKESSFRIRHVQELTTRIVIFFIDLLLGVLSLGVIAAVCNSDNYLERVVLIGTVVVTLLIHFSLYLSFNLYLLRGIFSKSYFLKRIFIIAIIEGSILYGIASLFHHFPMQLIAYYMIINYTALLLFRLLLRITFNLMFPKNHRTRMVFLYGSKSDYQEFIQSNDNILLELCGFLESSSVKDLKHYLTHFMQTNPVDIIVIGQVDHLTDIQKLVSFGEEVGIPVQINLRTFSNNYLEASLFKDQQGSAFLSFYYYTFTQLDIILKRLFDLSISFVGLLLLGLFYPFISLAIKLESKGPVFFKQRRIGQYGRSFYIYKFRSMKDGSDQLQKSLEKYNQRQGLMFKMENDPRVTKVGSFLRKTRLDEFPQFFNVFKGEMSIVGTRPPTENEVAKYELNYYKRLSIKPGITGLWQICDKKTIQNFRDVVTIDLEYIQKWSIANDIQIVLKTILYVFRFKDD